MSDKLAPVAAPSHRDSRVRFATTYRLSASRPTVLCTSSALPVRFAVFRREPLGMCIDIPENTYTLTYTHTMYPKRTIHSCLQYQRLRAIKCTSRNSPAQMVALQDGAMSLHVYAPALRRDWRPSPLGSPSCRGALRISVAQKARCASV